MDQSDQRQWGATENPMAKPRKQLKEEPANKTMQLIALLQGPGASVEAIAKQLGWLPHTLRARLSGLAKPPYGLVVMRERKDGVTTYRIA
jgi:hypothetical protein